MDPTRSPRSFAQLVEQIAALADDHALGGVKSVSVRDILSVVGSRAFAPLLLLLGLFSISPATIAPGMTWFSAALTLLVSLQMALGARHPWLPRRLLNVCMSRASVRAGADHMRPWARRIDRLLKSRWTVLTEAPFVNIAGLMCAVAALATFPLGLIPVAPVAPGVAIVLVALGLFAKDGLLLLAGGAVIGASIWLAYASLT